MTPEAWQGNVKFVESSSMDHVNSVLREIDAGDRIVRGRAILYFCHRHPPSPHLQRNENPEECEPPFSKVLELEDFKQTLASLVATMNQSFPDYDFSSIGPEKFIEETDMDSAVNLINHNLALVVERLYPGFIKDLWKAVQECIDLSNSNLFSLAPGMVDNNPLDAEEPENRGNVLWSFDYFFFDKVHHKILFLACSLESRRLRSVSSGLSRDRRRRQSSGYKNEYTSSDDELYPVPSGLLPPLIPDYSDAYEEASPGRMLGVDEDDEFIFDSDDDADICEPM
eukprot:Filipodium_phascolosomae@DN4916_c0_g1_i1.p1